MPTARKRADPEVESESSLGALGRGIRILQCFTTTVPDLTSRDLAERTGLPKPTLFRMLSTLKSLGMIRYSERSGKYTLAQGVLQLAAPALSAMPIRQLSRPLMQELADHARGQVSLAVGDGDSLVYVELIVGAGNLVFRPEVGTHASMSRTASGRAYLTLLDPAQRDAILNRRQVDPERQAWLRAKLRETEADLKQFGYARNLGELHRDTVGVAVPARTGGEQVFIFAVTVPAFRVSEQPNLLEELGMRLVALVHSVEVAFGQSR
ncbi:IclR family transcriptional regulator [soil metagenome]